MQFKTLQALRKSIEHHIRMRDGTNKRSETFGINDCALCELFIAKGCHECPVALKTGWPSCERSPYFLEVRAWHFYRTFQNQDNLQLFKTAADKEVKFLIGLMPLKARAAFLKKHPKEV